MDVDQGDCRWTFDNLPIEVLIHICRFLEPETILNVLPLVSKRFEEIAMDEVIWRIRISRRWPYKYPPGEPPQEFSWSSACSSREYFCKQWSNRSLMTEFVSVKAHNSAMDTLVLVKKGRLLISGSRDRSMALWRTNQMKHDELQSGLLQRDTRVNRGWIWSISYDPDTSDLISTGWDNMLHLWKLNNNGLDFQGSLNCRAAVLCSSLNKKLATVGTFDKLIKTYDLRFKSQNITLVEPGASKVEEFKIHKKPVLSVIVPSHNQDQIISASEDGTVALIDRRAQKVVKRTHFTKGYPMCMKQFHNALYVGDKAGNLHILDLSSASPLKVLKTIPNLHGGKVIGIDTDLGGIVTCSSDSKINLLQPDMSCGLIETIDCKEYGEVTSVAYCNGFLASGHSSERIQVWRPKKFNSKDI